MVLSIDLGAFGLENRLGKETGMDLRTGVTYARLYVLFKENGDTPQTVSSSISSTRRCSLFLTTTSTCSCNCVVVYHGKNTVKWNNEDKITIGVDSQTVLLYQLGRDNQLILELLQLQCLRSLPSYKYQIYIYNPW